MIIKNNFHLSYDLSGNMVITIPKIYIQKTKHKILLKSLEKMLDSIVKRNDISEDWNRDSAIDLVGIGRSDINDGSVHNDKYIYGLNNEDLC